MTHHGIGIYSATLSASVDVGQMIATASSIAARTAAPHASLLTVHVGEVVLGMTSTSLLFACNNFATIATPIPRFSCFCDIWRCQWCLGPYQHFQLVAIRLPGNVNVYNWFWPLRWEECLEKPYQISFEAFVADVLVVRCEYKANIATFLAGFLNTQGAVVYPWSVIDCAFWYPELLIVWRFFLDTRVYSL